MVVVFIQGGGGESCVCVCVCVCVCELLNKMEVPISQ